MSNKINMLLLLSLFLLLADMSYGQIKLEYNYDNAGNRIERKVLSLKSAKVNGSKSDNSTFDVNDTINEQPGIDILDDITLKLYPNPTIGKVIVELSNFSQETWGSLVVYDVYGSLIQSINIIDATPVINLSDQPVGTYILKIVINGVSSQWKIIKE